MNHDKEHRRAYRRAGAKLGFHIHLVAYVAVNALLVFLNFTTSPQVWWFKWPLAGWGIGLFAHWFAVYATPPLMRRAVEKELEKDRLKD